MSLYDNNYKENASSATNTTYLNMVAKPFIFLEPELSVGEKLLKEKLDKILANYYKLEDKDLKQIEEILKKF